VKSADIQQVARWLPPGASDRTDSYIPMADETDRWELSRATSDGAPTSLGGSNGRFVRGQPVVAQPQHHPLPLHYSLPPNDAARDR
jgi:hypothetical protein